MIGNSKAIDEAAEQLKTHGLVLKVSESLQDYLLKEIWFLKDKKKEWLRQPFLIESLEKQFGKQVMKGQHSKTLPNFLIRRPTKNAEKIG